MKFVEQTAGSQRFFLERPMRELGSRITFGDGNRLELCHNVLHRL